MINEEDTKKKIEFFFTHKTEVHINLLSDRFYNGLILELGKDFLLIQDKVIGEVFVLFSEIDWIDKYIPKERDDGK